MNHQVLRSKQRRALLSIIGVYKTVSLSIDSMSQLYSSEKGMGLRENILTSGWI